MPAISLLQLPSINAGRKLFDKSYPLQGRAWGRVGSKYALSNNFKYMNIIAISGSLREDSFNTLLLRAFQTLAPEDMKIDIVSIADVPMYDRDNEDEYPKEAQALKDTIAAADGIIIATPEYNRSIPGVLKNTIDWLSRPHGKNSFAKKPVLVAGVSSGKIGTAVAQSHLRQILLYLDANVIGQPELYLGPAKDLFDAEGKITNELTKELLVKALVALQNRIALARA